MSGIGIAVTLVTVIAQSRVQRLRERLKSKTDSKAGVVASDTRATIQDRFGGIERLTEEEFDGLIGRLLFVPKTGSLSLQVTLFKNSYVTNSE